MLKMDEQAPFQVIPAKAGTHPVFKGCRFPGDLDGFPPSRIGVKEILKGYRNDVYSRFP